MRPPAWQSGGAGRARQRCTLTGLATVLSRIRHSFTVLTRQLSQSSEVVRGGEAASSSSNNRETWGPVHCTLGQQNKTAYISLEITRVL